MPILRLGELRNSRAVFSSSRRWWSNLRPPGDLTGVFGKPPDQIASSASCLNDGSGVTLMG